MTTALQSAHPEFVKGYRRAERELEDYSFQEVLNTLSYMRETEVRMHKYQFIEGYIEAICDRVDTLAEY